MYVHGLLDNIKDGKGFNDPQPPKEDLFFHIPPLFHDMRGYSRTRINSQLSSLGVQ